MRNNAGGLPAHVDAILIGCVSQKNTDPMPAKDLYRSELFRRRRLWAEASRRPWWIVSAEYGLVGPDQVVAPYDTRIGRLPADAKAKLADSIADDLERGLGSLAGKVLELHAGDEYVLAIGPTLQRRGAQVFRPLQGLRIGEQLGWYGDHLGLERRTPGAPPKARRPAAPPVDLIGDARGLARTITSLFMSGELDLSKRREAPTPGWDGMPEVVAVKRLQELGATGSEVRLFLTFNAAMDRARDADDLARRAVRLFERAPWTYDPTEICHRSLRELTDALGRFGVSQRRSVDAYGWRLLGESLSDVQVAPASRMAIYDGVGDARELLGELQSTSQAGTPLFPLLSGSKISVLWIRLLAHPGGARIASMAEIPVAVDVQVRKVTEYLGVTDTGGLDLDDVRAAIQATWARDVAEHGTDGPPGLHDTPGALDPALWFYGKWGCSFCEAAGRKLPIAGTCSQCRFPDRA